MNFMHNTLSHITLPRLHCVGVLFAGIVSGLATTSTYAQNEPAENAEQQLPWYQIELIAFENRSFNSLNPDSETWPRDLLLAYPPRFQH